jgi:monofunctional biosynthetic peptidoglycan transglycosylase
MLLRRSLARKEGFPLEELALQRALEDEEVAEALVACPLVAALELYEDDAVVWLHSEVTFEQQPLRCFATHGGVDWGAINAAWHKNAKAEARAEARSAAAKGRPVKAPKIVGGSTITQQLAKNLFLSGERTIVRKSQELIITLLLEALLSKERILEIYLNNVEWGDGVFGAQAAARRYFRKDAAQLTSAEAARLAVMLPRPKFFEKVPGSEYLANRSALIQGRMSDAQLP